MGGGSSNFKSLYSFIADQIFTSWKLLHCLTVLFLQQIFFRIKLLFKHFETEEHAWVVLGHLCQCQVRLVMAVFTQVLKSSKNGDPPPLVSCPRAVLLSQPVIPNAQSKSSKLQVVVFFPCQTIIWYKKSLALSSLCPSWSSCQLQLLERAGKKVLVELV